ncbi:RNA polymerase sigma factor [Ktedonosporobacter rubrisoli]|nr:sigma-70 family RNA polymerase sigma factor [Ktedonosporobacter rubrisoli]
MPAAQTVEALIKEYGKLVFHTIYGLTGDWEESQDLTQDTFHQALRSIDAARCSSGEQFRPKAWLLRIALNTVRMQQRRRKLFRFVPFSLMRENRSAEQAEASHEKLNEQAIPVQPVGYGATKSVDPAELIAEQDAVQRTMARLPEALRVCLLLSIVAGLTTAEIAEMLELKEAAVRQRLVRARKQFQQAYAYESGEELFDNSQTAYATHPAQQDCASEQVLHEKSRHVRLAARPATTGRSYA